MANADIETPGRDPAEDTMTPRIYPGTFDPLTFGHIDD